MDRTDPDLAGAIIRPAPAASPHRPQKTFSAATAAAQPSQDPISANPPAAAALPPPRGALGGAAGGGLSGLESLAIGGSPGFYISTPRGTDAVGFGHRFTPH